MKKQLIFVVIFTLLISVFSLSAITADKAKFGGTIKVGITIDPETLNPLVANNRASSWILNNMYPTLLVFNEEAEKVPYVIEGYEISENGLDITVKLIEGLKWQDGVPFTTADVKFTGDIMYEGKYQWQADYFDRVKSVEIIDDLTIVYHMKEPSPGFITGIGFWQPIIPKHIWENIDNIKEFQNNENVVGMGPFKLVEVKRGQYYILESVDEWFGSPEGKPYLDRIVYRVYPDLNIF
ncbi:Oligopeptide-binding protein AppA [subsurface metagenome]